MKLLSDTQTRELASIDTPTISNAIEEFNVRSPTEGYTGPEVRCLLPELGVMVGYAVLATADTTTPSTEKERSMGEIFKAIQESPKPVVLVIKSEGLLPLRTCSMGEVAALAMRRLGAVGVVTDGCVRDISQLRKIGFAAFAAGTVASHGIPSVRKAEGPVWIAGMRVAQGDLIHGDENGLVNIPQECLAGIAVEARKILAEEKSVIEAMDSPDFPANVMPFFGVDEGG